MSRMKIYEYAKKIDKPAKELVTELLNHGVEVKSHMSVIDEKGIEIINKVYGIQLLENASSGRVLEKCGFETAVISAGMYSLIYTMLSSVGILIGALLHFALRKD